VLFAALSLPAAAQRERNYPVVSVPHLAKSTEPQAQVPNVVTRPGPEMEKLQMDALGWLIDLIRIDTTNPPGNELAAAKYIAGVLEKEGITAEVIESAPGRGIVIARLRAGAIPDPARALLLLGHTDVVGVDRAKWTVDPFSGEMKNGSVYGRGALDMKGPLVAHLAAFIGLKRSGVRLDRDVILLAEGDEEAGGEAGIEFAVRHHWDKIACGFALNEGGQTIAQDGKVLYVGVQASEKVAVNVHVIARGPAGHASIPRKDNPVAHLAAAVEKIAAFETPIQMQTVTRTYFERLAPLVDNDLGKWMRALDTPGRQDLAVKRLTETNPAWNAMLRNTISPTMLQAGVRVNVIPSEARASLNIRLLPGELPGPLIASLEKAVADPAIKFEMEPLARQQSPPSSIESELFKAIERTAPRSFPGAAVVPMMSTWATDSAQLRLRSVQALGIIPFPLTQEELARMHSDDERIPIDAFRRGVEFEYRIVEEFVRARN